MNERQPLQRHENVGPRAEFIPRFFATVQKLHPECEWLNLSSFALRHWRHRGGQPCRLFTSFSEAAQPPLAHAGLFGEDS